jgi:hypothetical protein
MRHNTNAMKPFLALFFLAFTAFSARVSWLHGYRSAFPPFADLPTLQIFCDLATSLAIVMWGMHRDWKSQGRPPHGLWPFIVLTFLFGSIGPMLYLLLRIGRDRQPPLGPAQDPARLS